MASFLSDSWLTLHKTTSTCTFPFNWSITINISFLISLCVLHVTRTLQFYSILFFSISVLEEYNLLIILHTTGSASLWGLSDRYKFNENGREHVCSTRVPFGGLIDFHTDENIFSTWTQALIKSSVWCDWWTLSVTEPAPPCSSEAQETVMSRKDVGAWWEAMIVCLKYLPAIITGITLHRQAASP